MNLGEVTSFTLGLSVVIERLLELTWGIIEGAGTQNNPALRSLLQILASRILAALCLLLGKPKSLTTPSDPSANKIDPNATDYISFKRNASIILGMLLGIGLLVLSYFFNVSLGNVGFWGKIAIGAIAGALAPYSHQIVEALYKLQQMLQSQTQVNLNYIHTAGSKSMMTESGTDNIPTLNSGEQLSSPDPKLN